jgi:hypothetical protein
MRGVRVRAGGVDTAGQSRLYPGRMRTLLGSVFLLAALSACSTVPEPATRLERANVLPLQLNDNFQFRKVKLAYLQPVELAVTQSEPVIFEQLRLTWGALDNADTEQRYGNYFVFFWRATERADVTVRLEYRQAGLGNYVMAQERYYPQARGSFESDFRVTGDEYLEAGRVTAWRALLIVEGKIVALRQSFLWR